MSRSPDGERTKRLDDTVKKILDLTRDELYMDLRFLNIALSTLVISENDAIVTTATDGEKLMVPGRKIKTLFKENPVFLRRLYLHSVLHCLFSHLWIRGDRDAMLWGIASDIAVERVIDSLKIRSTSRILSGLRKYTYEALDEQGAISAAGIYNYLRGLDSERLQKLYHEFLADDHALWPDEKRLGDTQVALMNKWQNIGKQSRVRKRRQGDDAGEGDGGISYQIRAARKGRGYRDFLREFMVLREELRSDPDEFDIGFYMYGLEIYKNMPLIEPLETTESHKIRDFVVVVDTSYSTSGELIVNFLKETFRILTEQDNFFRKGRVHLIQADDRVQEDIVLTDEDMIERLFADFEVRGGGNTDFRPAFEYVDDLLDKGGFDELCGLIYFTDGRGVYPEKMPAFKTAFIYLNEYERAEVPPWAIQLRIDLTELDKT